MYSDANVWASERVRTVIKTALVIGGGIAGPVAAMALQKAGIDAVVYEAYSSRADGAGGGLSLAPNGLDALDAIGLGDLSGSSRRPRTRTAPRPRARSAGSCSPWP